MSEALWFIMCVENADMQAQTSLGRILVPLLPEVHQASCLASLSHGVFLYKMEFIFSTSSGDWRGKEIICREDMAQPRHSWPCVGEGWSGIRSHIPVPLECQEGGGWHWSVCQTVLAASQPLAHWLLRQSAEVGAVITPISQRRKHTEVK